VDDATDSLMTGAEFNGAARDEAHSTPFAQSQRTHVRPAGSASRVALLRAAAPGHNHFAL
jgi:hypothetical protein